MTVCHLLCASLVRCHVRLQLRVAIEQRVRGAPAEIDMLKWMGRTALEIIGQVGLGHSFDPLTEDVQDEYTDAVKQLVYVLPPRLLPYSWS